MIKVRDPDIIKVNFIMVFKHVYLYIAFYKIYTFEVDFRLKSQKAGLYTYVGYFPHYHVYFMGIFVPTYIYLVTHSMGGFMHFVYSLLINKMFCAKGPSGKVPNTKDKMVLIFK